MDLVTSKDEMNVGVKILDCDHREMTEAIYEIQAAVMAGEDPQRTGTLLRKLADFTLTHFALEEGMMVATKYPGLARHRLNHQRMIEQVHALTTRHNRGALTLDLQALNLLSELHTTHIQHDDRHYGSWLNEIGRNQFSNDSHAVAQVAQASFGSEVSS